MRLWLLLAGWVVLALGGAAMLICYDDRPCEAACAPALWPVDSHLRRSVRLPTLLMFIHPQCPCSRASLLELARLRARCSALQVVVIVAQREGVEQDPSLLALARAQRGVVLVVDTGLAETLRFGAFTSGQVLVYSPAGRLQFTGGLTVSRGHEGPSPGAEALLRAVEQPGAALEISPVFGCELGSQEFCGTRHKHTKRP